MEIKILVPSLAGLLFVITFLLDSSQTAVAQETPLFELPVQLVGFPVIIIAVRLANFVKKLAYSLNPQTYKSRNRRNTGDLELISDRAIDISLAEKQILSELGPKACILEEPCRIHANRKARSGAEPEWGNILSNYKHQQNGMKQWYLLSVFMGDVLRDASLCKHLAKRLQCGRSDKLFIRD